MYHKVKGTGFMVIKKLIEEKGAEAEQALRARLTPYSLKIWNSITLALAWVEDDFAIPGSVLYEAAMVLFPGDPKNALLAMGKIMAKKGMPIYYQMFIRIPTPQFVFKSVAQIWRRFYFDGDASVEEFGPKQAVFILRNFPDYNENMRIYMKGYLLGISDLLGLKNMTVTIEDGDPQAWKWVMAWT
jgi:hypothetical protein